MIIDANSWKIDKLLSILLDLRNRAQKDLNNIDYFDEITEREYNEAHGIF